MKKCFFVLALFLAFLGCARAESDNKKKEVEGKVGLAKSMIAPDFTLDDIEGNSHTLSGYRGKVVLVDFWATWCPPCVVEIPHFVKLYNKYKEKGFVILGVSLDTDEKRLRDFIEEKEMEYPVLVNAGKVSVIYAVEAIPTAYMIDKEGRIAGKFVGYRPGYEKEIEKLSLKLIEEKDE
jgi:peroxiredoxin